MSVFNIGTALQDLRQQPGVHIAFREDTELRGVQFIVRFLSNGYGASIIRNPYSYGVELAIVKFYGTGDDDFELDDDTILGTNVKGWLDQTELLELLNAIRNLNTEE